MNKNPKSEIRNPKSEIRKKAEIRSAKVYPSFLSSSDFGFRT